MRSKRKTRFVCSDCGAVSARWQGRCATCEAWNTLEEELAPTGKQAARSFQAIQVARPTPLSELGTGKTIRQLVGIGEFDRVLGGGVVPGSILLLGGEPGIGKSTLLLQAAKAFGQQRGLVLYVSGEESAEQIRLRAERLKCLTPEPLVLAETDLDRVLAQMESIEPALVIIDSVQTMTMGSIDRSEEHTSELQSRGQLVCRLLVDKKKKTAKVWRR